MSFVVVLLSLDTSYQFTKDSKQNIIQCLDKLKALYQICQLLGKLAHHKTLLNLLKKLSQVINYTFLYYQPVTWITQSRCG